MTDKDENVEAADVAQEMRALRAEVARLNGLSFVRIHNSIPRLLSYSLARGMAFGLGTVLGASLLLSVLAWSISQIEFLPIVGEWAAEIVRQIEASMDPPATPE